MVECDGLENRYSGRPESWVRIPLPPPKLVQLLDTPRLRQGYAGFSLVFTTDSVQFHPVYHPAENLIFLSFHNGCPSGHLKWFGAAIA